MIMSDSWLRREVTITNAEGMHLRPADMFVRLANQFQAQVVLCRDTLRVNGKSILDIATLGAAQGTALVIEACGDDAAEALEALAELVRHGFRDIARESEEQLPGAAEGGDDREGNGNGGSAAAQQSPRP